MTDTRKHPGVELESPEGKRTRLEDVGYVQDTRKLARKYPHARDDKLYFRDSDHTYILRKPGEEDRLLVSASALVKDSFEPFVDDEVIDKMHGSPYWRKSKYYPMTREQIKAKWESNRQLGTDMHDVIERYLNAEEIEPRERETVEFQQFLDFESEWLSKLGVDVYRTEWRVYDEEYGMSGTLDWICVYKEQTDPDVLSMVLLDHKRSPDLKEKETRYKGRGCCSDLPDNAHIKYGLSLDVYKYMLEKNYHDLEYNGHVYKDLHVESMYLNVMHPDRTTYRAYGIVSRQDKIAEMLLLKKNG